MEQLQGIGGGRSLGFGPNKIRSLPDAVARAISLHFGFTSKNNHDQVALPAQDLNTQQVEVEAKVGDICPSCGAPAMVFEEGCAKCHACGHSEC